MRHKYQTRGMVLARSPLGEANALVSVLTPGLGLVRARAQGVRRSGAKLSAALATLSESSFVLVRGKEGWRITGAVLEESWFPAISRVEARRAAARVSGLMLRLVAGETHDPGLFLVMSGFFSALATLPDDALPDAEILAALRILRVLGFDAGDIPGELADFGHTPLRDLSRIRSEYIARINRGLQVSGL